MSCCWSDPKPWVYTVIVNSSLRSLIQSSIGRLELACNILVTCKSILSISEPWLVGLVAHDCVSQEMLMC